MNSPLKYLFHPVSIAVIGASNHEEHAGYSIYNNLRHGYQGKLYAVNPNRKKIQGHTSFRSVSAIKEPVELAILAVPAEKVVTIADECGRHGVKALLVVSAGFIEAGKAGKELSHKLAQVVKKYSMCLLGPNCLGFICPHTKLNASFAKTEAIPGSIAFISQSGALCSSILDWAAEENVGFSYFVSIGDMVGIGYADLIDYFLRDAKVTSLVIYMESLTDARRFLSSARAFSRNKPILVLKAGMSNEGAKAALSHTGNLAGNDAAYSAAFRRAGILRVHTVEELFDAAQTLTLKPTVSNKRLAIVTNAGGPGVVATDALIQLGGKLSQLSPATTVALSRHLKKSASISNPIDVLGDAGPSEYKHAIETVLADENVDAALVIVTPQMMTDIDAIAQVITQEGNPTGKLILTCFLGGKSVHAAIHRLTSKKIRNYESPEDAVVSFMNMYRYTKGIDLLYETPSSIPSKFSPKQKEARLLIDKTLKRNVFSLNEYDTKKMLELYDIPVTDTRKVTSPKDAAEAADHMGFPVILKVLSPDIPHKTEVGGYVADIRTKKDVELSYSYIVSSVKKHAPHARIDGITIERMQKKRYELFLGSKKDALFGPVIVFGMGGVAVEVFEDVATGLPPLNMMLAKQLIERTKISKLLQGYRSIPGVDMNELEFILYKFAYLVSDFPDISSIDINPLGIDEHSAIVLDAKITLDPDLAGKSVRPYTHMVISPYPSQYVKEIHKGKGRQLVFRPIRPEDEPLEAELFKTFSEESQRFRFFGLKKNVTHEILTRYTNIDYDREIAIIAELIENNKKKMIGVVRFLGDPDMKSAEVAIILGDPWHGKGIGAKLLDYGLSVAKSEGIKKVYAYVLEDNDIMLHMFQKRQFTVSREEDYFKVERILS